MPGPTATPVSVPAAPLGGACRRGWRGRRTGAPGGLLLAGLGVAALSLLPIVFLVLEVRGVSLSEAHRLLFRPRIGRLLTNTLGLVAASTVLCAVVGVAAAWCVERTELPGRRVWMVLLVLPLAIPEFVSSFGWVSFLPGLRGFGGALLVTVVAYYPFVFLPVAAVLRGTNPALEEVARGMGLSGWRAFWRVTLPQLRLPVLGGGLIIALHLLAEYGAFAQLRFPTFATEIYVEYQLGFDGASAAVLSLVLVLLSLALLTAEVAARGRGRYARVGGGATRPHRRVRLGRRAAAVLGGLTLLVVLALGVPLSALVYWVLQGSSSTLPSSSVWGATVTTLEYAAAAAAVTTVLALPVALLSVRYRGAAGRGIERTTYVPRALPGVVIGLAMVSFSLRSAHGLYQTSTLLVLAYAILFLPLAIIALRGPLAQVTPRIEDVARSLGLGPVRAFLRTTFPLLRSGIGAGAGLVFLSTVTELTGTLLLRPTGTETLATRFWTYASSLSYGAAAPYAAVMVGISALPAYLLIRRVDEAGA
ncbi:iron ABC transporter permease [Paraconexibacter antarcticus]|uniref:Iron ABC transporter permease n=1 Tax=Paraconexibacter antarcticus TaxID=2949664 RepID=A0ABY5DR54_9ACTN|nr:iron ABC transporter permease [Paraconexibacter antarcticus]UTI63733.1 iron ABC transporter permease [Paraconexibacter antarcticus]